MLCLKWTYSSILLVILALFLIKTTTKNVCPTYFDYLLINFNDNCFYNEDVYMSVPDTIKKYTGDVQIYNVTTSDGYILKLFRIYQKDPIGVVLFQPPISTGSIAWVSDGPNSIAIELWKKGYDVWLSNHRGSPYSREHIEFNTSDPKFWNFGFHEIALLDLDAQFEIIRNKTNSKFSYIGYSMSATEALIYASLKLKEAKTYIDSFILIAPLANLKHFTSPFKFIMIALRPFENFFRMGEFFTFEFLRTLCGVLNIAPIITNFFTSIVMGWTLSEMDPILYPYVFAHHGRGITNQMILHYGQIFKSNKFQMYDYGIEINRVKYGSDTPPVYPLNNIKNSIYIVHGDKDSISTPQDMKILSEEMLPKEVVAGIYEIPNTNHIDYLFSKHRRKKTYETVFSILEKRET